MGLVAEQAAFLLDATKLIQHAAALGFMVTGGELYRTKEQQDIYLKTGFTKTANSLHMSRLAIDLNFFKDGRLISDKNTLAPLGAFWESLHPLNSWGGNGVTLYDPPHFSRGRSKPEWARVT